MQLEQTAPRRRGPGGPDDRAAVGAGVRVTALVLLAVQLGLVGWLTLRPVAVAWVEPANLELLANIRAAVDDGPRAAAETIAAGVLPLAPLGVLLPALGRRLGGSRFVSFTRTVFAGAMIALGFQLLRSAVPSRVVDMDQVLLATVGIALVHLLCYRGLRALLRTPGRRPPAATSTALGQEAASRSARAPAAEARMRGAWTPRGSRPVARGPQGPQGPQGSSPTSTRVAIGHRAEALDGSLPVR